MHFLFLRYRTMSAKPPRILIAEDLDENRIALKLMLKLVGFEPLEACDGEQAIEMVRRERPDLVLMDISLPIIDGLQATRELRAVAELRQLPIIIVSAYDNPETRDEACAAGGTDYISKPIEFEHLKEMIEKYLLGTRGQEEEETGDKDLRFEI
jgi:two-component system, cell cycle response regulator DivK